MSVLTKKVVIETMSMNTRVPKQLYDDIADINKKLEEYKLGLEIVLSKIVIKAMKEAKRQGEKVINEHEVKLKASKSA